MTAQQPKIGVIDSGVGGRTVLNQLVRHKPDAHYLFIGDNRRAPYGDRTTEVISAMALQMVDRLVDSGVCAVVIACNTISARSIDALRAKHPTIPMIGTIEASTRQIAHGDFEHIGLLATQSTVNSGAFSAGLHAYRPELRIDALGCPKFVPLIEANAQSSPEMDAAIAETLAPWRGRHFDLVILGCTHYPIIQDGLRHQLGKSVRFFDPAIPMAKELVCLLPDEASDTGSPAVRTAIDFYTSGSLDTFKALAEVILAPKCLNSHFTDAHFHTITFPEITA